MNDKVLTIGYSTSLLKYFKHIKEAYKLNFDLIVAEQSPSFRGLQMAAEATKLGINCICIPDSNIYSYTTKVNKLMLGCHAIMGDGGIIGISGLKIGIHAAHMNSVPVIVIAPWYKLTPLYPFDSNNELYSPNLIFKQTDESN